jgi:hypothetical protein
VEDAKKTLGFHERAEEEEGVPKWTKFPGLPKTIYIKKEERRNEMFSWYLYKLLRAIYVPWFYFMPSCFFFGQYLAPFLLS